MNVWNLMRIYIRIAMAMLVFGAHGVGGKAWAYSTLPSILKDPEKIRGKLMYSGMAHSSADIGDQRRSLDSTDHTLELSVPTSRDRRSAVVPFFSMDYRTQFSDGVLGGDPVPGDLHGAMIGADVFFGGGTWSLSGGAGYRTDRLLPAGDGLIVDATLAYHSRSRDSRWIFLVHFSNNRNYLNALPIPGIVYQGTIGKNVILYAGFPVTYLRYAPLRLLKLDFGVIPGYSAFAQASYGVETGESILLGARFRQEGYLLSERERAGERLLIGESTVYLGIESVIVPGFKLEIRGGVLAQKNLKLTESLLEESRASIDLDPALFGTVELLVSF